MQFGTFLAIAALTLIVLGWYLGYRAAPNREARAMLKKQKELDQKQKEREEAEGREKNRQAVFQKDAVGALEKILSGRQALEDNSKYGSMGRDPKAFERAYPSVHAFLKLFKHNEFRTEDVLRHKKRIAALEGQVTDLQLQLQEIHKALQLGQPVE